jgi:hypothetical protein
MGIEHRFYCSSAAGEVEPGEGPRADEPAALER